MGAEQPLLQDAYVTPLRTPLKVFLALLATRPGTMGVIKTEPPRSGREVLAGLVERVTYRASGRGFPEPSKRRDQPNSRRFP
jgi:hypothetical protein